MINKWLGNAEFWKPAIRLGFPVALQNLLVSSFGLVDTWMLGQLGDVAVASVGMASQWAWLMTIIFYGASSGAAVFLSQYWGAKDMNGIRKSYGILAVTMLSIALIMSIIAVLFPSLVLQLFTTDPEVSQVGVSYLRIAGFSYIAMGFSQIFNTVLRSTEEVRLPLFASIFGVGFNALLNYGFIFGKFGLPELGVPGAAVATVISAYIGPTILFMISFRKKNMIICKLKELFQFDRAFLGKYFRITIPVLVNECLWAVGTMGYNMIIGRIGTIQYAAQTIFKTIESFFFAFYIGICHACGILVGREIGAGRVDEAVRYANRFTIVMPIASAIVGVLIIASRSLFLSKFKVTPEVVQIAKTILLIYALEMPIRNTPFITICGVFRPGGDTKTGLLYDVLTVWLIALPITFVCGLILKLDFILVYIIMLISEDWIKTWLSIRRLLSKKWINPVVEHSPLAD